ncbi:MAG: glutamate-cysteine ligase family protein [Candidatus Hodarchaeota archaeon]
MTDCSLRFSIGYEMETQIVNRDGSLLVGTRMKPTWNELLARAAKKLATTPKMAECPAIVRERFKGVKLREIEKGEKRFRNVGVYYTLNPKAKPLIIDAFGPDPNLSQITWILEMVTPPCQSMEELQFWCSHLYDTALQSLPPKKYGLISTGFNPLEKEYRSGLTFGDHIHIGGFKNDRDRIKAYNLIRNFVPHLIAISGNSPFIDGLPTNVPKITEKDNKIRILGGKCVKSLRLVHNKSQLGPCDVERYVPYLRRPNPADFDAGVGRGYPDNRMVDIFPFTRWGTIELRFFDCQFSIAHRLAIVSILEALCLKAVQMGTIPEVAARSIVENREKAVEFGLLGTFLQDRSLGESFAAIYNKNPITNRKTSRMFEAVQSLLVWLQPEFNQLGLQQYLTPVYASVFGTEKLHAPCGPADYLLFLYQQKYREKIDRLVQFLQSLSEGYCAKANPIDPISQTFGKPILPDFTSLGAIALSEEETQTAPPSIPFDVKIDITSKAPVLAGQRVPFKIQLKNIQKQILMLKVHTKLFQESSVLYSNLKELSVGPLKSLDFSPPAGVPVGTIKGKSPCYLQILVSDQHDNTLNLRSPSFEVIGSPEVKMKLFSPPRVGKGHSLKISLVNSTPTIAQKFTLSARLLIIETGQDARLASKAISIARTKNIALPLPTPSKGENARITVTISYKGKTIASEQTENIPLTLSPSPSLPASSARPSSARSPPSHALPARVSTSSPRPSGTRPSSPRSTAQSPSSSRTSPSRTSSPRTSPSRTPSASSSPTPPSPTRPSPTRPSPTRPSTTRPSSTRPSTTRPSTTRPSTTRPSTTRPSSTHSSPTRSSAPRRSVQSSDSSSRTKPQPSSSGVKVKTSVSPSKVRAAPTPKKSVSQAKRTPPPRSTSTDKPRPPHSARSTSTVRSRPSRSPPSSPHPPRQRDAEPSSQKKKIRIPTNEKTKPKPGTKTKINVKSKSDTQRRRKKS